MAPLTSLAADPNSGSLPAGVQLPRGTVSTSASICSLGTTSWQPRDQPPPVRGQASLSVRRAIVSNAGGESRLPQTYCCAAAGRSSEPPYHSQGKGFSFAFSIGPEYVMRKFVIDGLNPHALALINAAALPVFRVNQMDTPILKRASCRPASVDVFVPFDSWPSDRVKTAKIRDRLLKSTRPAMMKISG
jgi:hypothetical protein